MTVYTVNQQIAAIHHDHMYSITLSAGSDTKESALQAFDRYEPLLTKVAASFVFED